MYIEKVKLPDSVRRVVVALCADYERRRIAIENHTVTPRTENEYKYYNYKIFDAVAETVGPTDADTFIYEIGASRGFSQTSLTCYGEHAYKYKKGGAVKGIAIALHLID